MQNTFGKSLCTYYIRNIIFSKKSTDYYKPTFMYLCTAKYVQFDFIETKK